MRKFSSVRRLIVLLTIFILSGTASAQTITLKAAQVSGVTGAWGSVSFGQTITDPIVVAGPLSYADTQPAGVRVRNVTPTGFQVQAQEWDSQDGTHGAESLSYVAVAGGRYTLDLDGKVVLAASASVTGGGFQTKTFSQPFPTVPIIIATVVTQNEVSAVAVQIKDVTTTNFKIRLWEQEANSQSHVAETVHYLAWSPGSGTVNGLDFQVGSRTADHNFATATFSPAFASMPAFVAGSQTVAGAEAYSLRYQGLGTGSVQVRLQEDDSFDTEFFHVLETVGYLAITTAAGGGNQAPDGVIDTPAEAGTPDITITVGGSVNFTGTGTDPDNNTPLTYLWDFGASGIAQSTAQDPGSKVFNTAGTFTVIFTVTDNLGLADPTPATRTIQVNAAGNQAPNGVIDTPAEAGNPDITITVGGSVNFTGTGTDPENNTPLTYLWNFGTSGIAQSTVQDPGSKVFNTAGTFTVTFTVTDNLGLADSTPATRTIQVNAAGNQAPNGVIDTPAEAGNPDITITVGGSVNFTGTGTDPDNNTPLTYLWDFGSLGDCAEHA